MKKLLKSILFLILLITVFSCGEVGGIDPNKSVTVSLDGVEYKYQAVSPFKLSSSNNDYYAFFSEDGELPATSDDKFYLSMASLSVGTYSGDNASIILSQGNYDYIGTSDTKQIVISSGGDVISGSFSATCSVMNRTTYEIVSGVSFSISGTFSVATSF